MYRSLKEAGMFVWLWIALPVFSSDISSFMLGTEGTFHEPAVRHGTYAFQQIRVKFDTDVFVDFYDLQLRAIAPTHYSIPFEAFTYDSASHTAIWTIAGQPDRQNERFQAILSGVWDTSGTLLTAGAYTNEFTVLTGDVSGDDHVAPIDELLIIDHLNGPGGYDPILDVNADGFVTPQDALIVLNVLEAPIEQRSLVAPGPYHAVSHDPPAQLEISEIHCQGKQVDLQFHGLPVGCRCTVESQQVPGGNRWLPVAAQFITNSNDSVSFLMHSRATNEFYRASFR